MLDAQVYHTAEPTHRIAPQYYCHSFPPSVTTLIVYISSPSHTHSCTPPQLLMLDRHCTRLERQDGEQMNPSKLFMWSTSRECRDGNRQFPLSQKMYIYNIIAYHAGLTVPQIELHVYIVCIYLYQVISNTRAIILYWWWDLLHWVTFIIYFIVHNCRFNQIIASRSFSHLQFLSRVLQGNTVFSWGESLHG